jgi:hypothetical protein
MAPRLPARSARTSRSSVPADDLAGVERRGWTDAGHVDERRREFSGLEVLPGVITFPVATSAGGGSPGARFVLLALDREFAALPSA